MENEEHVFVVHLQERVAVQLSPGEHAEYAWLDRNQALARASSWTDRAALKTLVPLG